MKKIDSLQPSTPSAEKTPLMKILCTSRKFFSNYFSKLISAVRCSEDPQFAHLDNLTPELKLALAIALIDEGSGYRVVENLEKFKGVDHNEIVKRLIDKDQIYMAILHYRQFRYLNEDLRSFIDSEQVRLAPFLNPFF